MARPRPQFIWLPVALGLAVAIVAVFLAAKGGQKAPNPDSKDYYPDICLSVDGCCPNDYIMIDGQRMCPREG